MERKRGLAALVAAGVLLAAPALAQQQTDTANKGDAPSSQTDTTSTTNAGTTAPADNARNASLNGSLQKTHDEWRASKVVGQTVYDENGQSLGTVDDLLLDDQGKITQAVISVGGFLGIGGKLVAVPYDQLKFEPNRMAANTAAPGNPNAGPALTSGMATSTVAAGGTNTAATSSGGPPNTTGGDANAGRTPIQYFSVVMKGANKSTLTSMTEFRYAG